MTGMRVQEGMELPSSMTVGLRMLWERAAHVFVVQVCCEGCC